MPLYEYACDACGHRFEKIQKFSDPLEEACPTCAGHVQKLISSPAIQFKGSGFYITDYPKGDKGSAPKSDGGKADKAEKDKPQASDKSATSEKTDKADKAVKAEKIAGSSDSSASSPSAASSPSSSATPSTPSTSSASRPGGDRRSLG